MGAITLIGLAVIAWVPGSVRHLMLAPAVGLALVVAFLGTVAGLGAAGTLGSVVLATLIVIAVVVVVARFASRLRQTRARLAARALIAPALAVIGPMALFLAPFVVGRTLGPVALYANDPWYWYVPMETYLSDYEVGQALDRGFLAAPLQISDLLHLGIRAGFDATIAAIAGVTGLAPDQLFTPTIAAIVGTMGATVYYLARQVIGGARWFAVGAAWLTCTSVVLVPAFEGSGRALIAYTLFPVALYATWRAITRTAGYATIGLAGVAVAGLASAYSEGIPALVLALVALLTWALVWRPQTARAADGSTENPPKRSTILLRFTTIPVLAFALSPIAAMRAIEFLRGSSGIVAGSPSWGVVADNIFPWVFGLRNLFESRRQALLEPEKLVVLYALVAAGLLLVALGMRHIKREHRVWLISGAGAVGALSAWLYFGEHCDYCWYRSLAFLAPFLGLLAAAGLDALVRQARGSRKTTRAWLAWAGTVIALLFVAAIGRTSLSTITTASGSQMMTPAGARAIRPFLQNMPRSKPVLIEGTDSGPWMTAWFWSNLATMLTANAGRLPVYDRSVGTFVNYGNVRRGIEIDPYRPDYSEVVTPYGGIKGPRRVELTSEDLVVMRRGPIDVSPQMKGRWSRDPREPAATAIPHISGDFDLVVAGPPATDVAVSVTLEGPVAGSARFAATSPGGIGLPTRVARPRPSTQTICILAKTGPRGTARITLTPRQPLPIVVPGYVQPDEALPALPKDLNLVALRADRAGSPSACSTD